MDNTQKNSLRKMMDFAKANPESDYAKTLFTHITSGAADEQAQIEGIDLSRFGRPPLGRKGLEGIATGVGKGILSTVKGAGQLGEKIGHAILPDFAESPSVYSEEALQESNQKGELMGKFLSEQALEPRSTSEKIGKTIEQIAEFAIPGTKISKVTSALPLVSKIGTRGLVSGTTAAVQSGDVGKEAGIAAGVEAVLPVAGKYLAEPAKNFTSRLFKGLASGLSGVGSDTIEQIVKNPQAAKQTISVLEQGGNKAVLEKNAKTIIDGVSNIKKQAREAYGSGLEALAQTDIKPKTFRDSIQTVLDKYGSKVQGNTRVIENVEFSDPVNLKKASSIIDKISNTNLDGKSLKKVLDFIDSKKYSIATTDERLAYNAFVNDMGKAVKDAVSKSTDKLNDINKNFSQDMQLAEAVEGIFGKVKFKNSKELNKVSQQLETLFSKKGLSPDYIDDFLTRIGIPKEEFKTSEAVRQISKKVSGPNAKGLGLGELLQQTTSAIVTPENVRNIAVKTGMSEPAIKELMEKIAPAARAGIIELLIGSTSD